MPQVTKIHQLATAIRSRTVAPPLPPTVHGASVARDLRVTFRTLLQSASIEDGRRNWKKMEGGCWRGREILHHRRARCFRQLFPSRR
ncbi:hypothetical protein Dimus_035504, partial [Dionaea muscipula]